MTTVAAIAAKALDAVSARITDAIPSATLTRAVYDAYDAANDAYEQGTPIVQTGRAVNYGEAPKPDMFPGFVIGSGDQWYLLEGFTSVVKNDVLTIGGRDRTIVAVQDIVEAGTLFSVVAR